MTDTATPTPTLSLPDPAQLEAFLNTVDPVLGPLISSTPIGAVVHNVMVPLLHILLQFDIQHQQQNPGQPATTNPARPFVWQQITNILSTLQMSVAPKK